MKTIFTIEEFPNGDIHGSVRLLIYLYMLHVCIFMYKLCSAHNVLLRLISYTYSPGERFRLRSFPVRKLTRNVLVQAGDDFVLTGNRLRSRSGVFDVVVNVQESVPDVVQGRRES